jgi:hypothetical protein
MWKTKFKTLAIAALAFTLGFSLGAVSPSVIREVIPPYYPRDWVETDRVTSPDGRFDAVMVRQSVGDPKLGFEWSLQIVPRAQRPQLKIDNPLFLGVRFDQGQLVWKKPHLVEIHYRSTRIKSFRNIWSLDEVQKIGENAADYFVEIRLCPSLPDYSLLTPEGEFQPSMGE